MNSNHSLHLHMYMYQAKPRLQKDTLSSPNYIKEITNITNVLKVARD